MLTAIVVVPTPPFGEKQAITLRTGRSFGSWTRAGDMSTDRWKRSSSASTRASSSRASNGLAMTSSAPASRKRMRSSTSSDWLMQRTGTADSAGVWRISRQMSAAVLARVAAVFASAIGPVLAPAFGLVTTSMITSW